MTWKRTGRSIVLLAAAAVLADGAAAGEITKIRTGGSGWFTTCHFVGFFCNTHRFDVPETVSRDQTLARIVDGDDYGEFRVHSIGRDVSGRCYLYSSVN